MKNSLAGYVPANTASMRRRSVIVAVAMMLTASWVMVMARPALALTSPCAAQTSFTLSNGDFVTAWVWAEWDPVDHRVTRPYKVELRGINSNTTYKVNFDQYRVSNNALIHRETKAFTSISYVSSYKGLFGSPMPWMVNAVVKNSTATATLGYGRVDDCAS